MFFRRAHSGLGWAERSAGLRKAAGGLGTEGQGRIPVQSDPGLGDELQIHSLSVVCQECKPQWLPYLSLFGIHWGGLLGIQVPGLPLDILTQEVWEGLQTNHAWNKAPAKRLVNAKSFVEIVLRVPATSPKTQLSVCRFSNPRGFHLPEKRPNKIYMGLCLLTQYSRFSLFLSPMLWLACVVE